MCTGMDDVGAVAEFWRDHLASSGVVESEDRLLSIGEFARRSRLSMRALRLYERLGLLTPDHVDKASRYRRYRDSQLGTARLVAMLRRLDMPLAEVANIVSAPRPHAAELLAVYWDSVERRVASQRELVTHLRIRLSDGEGVFGMFDNIQQREVPEQLVLTEQRHVQVDELSQWLGTAMTRLDKAAQEYGGTVAPQYVVFHGEVNQDSDGPCGDLHTDRSDPRGGGRGADAPRARAQRGVCPATEGAGCVPADPLRVRRGCAVDQLAGLDDQRAATRDLLLRLRRG